MFVGKVKAVEVDNVNGFIYLLRNNRIKRRTIKDSYILTTHMPNGGKLKCVISVNPFVH